MPWFLRGLRDGVVTTGYPRRPDAYADDFPGSVRVLGPPARRAVDLGPVVQLCPTGAISTDDGQLRLDGGRCILCGRCVAARPELFAWAPGSRTARDTRASLVVPAREPSGPEDDPAALASLRSALGSRVRALRRSVHLRHIDVGSDGSEEWEIAALTNPVYDVHRLGIFFTASPRHADVLLVTGAGSRGLLAALARTVEAMPRPVVVIAVGTDAISGGMPGLGYATVGGVGDQLAVDVWVPGSPPGPFAILHGILLALGRLPAEPPAGRDDS